jgi:hypothetical protein
MCNYSKAITRTATSAFYFAYATGDHGPFAAASSNTTYTRFDERVQCVGKYKADELSGDFQGPRRNRPYASYIFSCTQSALFLRGTWPMILVSVRNHVV